MTEADLGKGVVSVTLVPCEGEKAGSMALENVPSKGQWYSFDVARMSESIGLPASTAACDLIQVDPSPNSSLPLKKKVRGVVKVVFASSARAAAHQRSGMCWPFCTCTPFPGPGNSCRSKEEPTVWAATDHSVRNRSPGRGSCKVVCNA
jgi:cytochrome oxidase assembly protein ShyY1